MNKKEMETFRQRLLKLDRRFRGDVDSMENEAFHTGDGMAAGNLSNRPVEDLVELAFDNDCEDTTIGLIENASLQLREVDAALKRIDCGTFGSCEKCGQDISSKRLLAVPFARQCITCAETNSHPLHTSENWKDLK